MICVRLKYLTESQTEVAHGLLSEISKMLNALIKKLTTDH